MAAMTRGLFGDLRMFVDHIPTTIEIQAFIARPLHSMAALKSLTIDGLLFVISPCHEMNMTHTEHLNLDRYGYIKRGTDFLLCA